MADLLESVCDVCGVSFVGAFTTRRQLTCSRKCNTKLQNRRVAEARPVRMESRPCEGCGDTFTFQIKAGPRRRFCAPECSTSEFHRRNPDWRRRQKLRFTWKLTPEAYEALLARGCEVCGATEDLKIDHDHACCPDSNRGTCGRCIRGVLCGRCNAAEGMLLGDPERAMQLAFYMLKNANVLEALNA